MTKELATKELEKALTAWARWFSARLDRIIMGNPNNEDYGAVEQDLFEAIDCDLDPFDKSPDEKKEYETNERRTVAVRPRVPSLHTGGEGWDEHVNVTRVAIVPPGVLLLEYFNGDQHAYAPGSWTEYTTRDESEGT